MKKKTKKKVIETREIKIWYDLKIYQTRKDYKACEYNFGYIDGILTKKDAIKLAKDILRGKFSEFKNIELVSVHSMDDEFIELFKPVIVRGKIKVVEE